MKELKRNIKALVSEYAKHDPLSGGYVLEISDLPEFTLHELAAGMMASDPCYAAEATSPDNPSYDKIMLPALLAYLQNTTDKDKQIEFMDAWRDGVTRYFTNHLLALFDFYCLERTHSEQNEKGFYSKTDSTNGEVYWS